MAHNESTDYYSPISFMKKLYDLELKPTLFVDVVYYAREKLNSRFGHLNIKSLALFINKKWLYYADSYALLENEFVINFNENMGRRLNENIDFCVLRIEAATSHFNDIEFHRSKLKPFIGKTDMIIENNFFHPDQFNDSIDEIIDYNSYV